MQLNTPVLIWGGTAMFPKALRLPVVEIVSQRAAIGAAAIVIVSFVLRSSVRLHSRSDGVGMMALGVLVCGHWLTFFAALKMSSAAIAILALYTHTVFAPVIEALLFRYKVRLSDLGIAAGVFTGIMIMTPEISSANTTTQAIALGVVSGFFLLGRNLLTRVYIQDYSSGTIMAWQMTVVALVLSPWAPVSVMIDYPRIDIMLLLLLGTVFTALPQMLVSSSLRNLSATTVSVVGMLMPCYGAIFGYSVHDETLDGRTVIGGMIILTCCAYECFRRPVTESGMPAVTPGANTDVGRND